jgi:hypothetical protein
LKRKKVVKVWIFKWFFIKHDKKNVDLSSTSGLFGLRAKMLAYLRFFFFKWCGKIYKVQLIGEIINS